MHQSKVSSVGRETSATPQGGQTRSGLRLPVFRLSALQFVLYSALFFTTLGNLPLWERLWTLVPPHDPHSALFALTLPVTIFATLNLVFSLFAWPYLRKPLMIALLLISAGCSYFMLSYNVIIDRGMVQNFFETNQAELASYLSLPLLLFVLVLGVLPALLVCRIRFKKNERNWAGAAAWCGNIALSLLALVSIAFFFYKDYASLFRNNRTLVNAVMPVNYLKNTYSYYKHRFSAMSRPLIRIGEDAVRAQTVSSARPRLLILVIGETARAQNFQLNGYARPTNPYLSKRDGVIAFQSVASCGTATAVSLPCMFSRMPRADFSEDRAATEENLTDVLQRAGIEMLWRDNNNGGCKGVCARIPSENMPRLKLAELCANADGTCYDDILLYRLDEKISTMTGDAVIVLHQLGSHGPTYYARYPESGKVFTPTCDTNQIQNCSNESLVNTYDNTLAYTDKMLDDTIALLEKHENSRDVAMIYLSDHGESLGEKGFYLHGAPYFIAPEEQKRIPMVMWFSPSFARDAQIDLACLKRNAGEDDYSQDNLFHSVLGLFSVRTREYRRDLDLFAECRPTSLPLLAAER